VFLEVGAFVGGSTLQWLRNSPDKMTLIAADIWDKGAEDWVSQMADEPPSWIADLEPVLALQAALKESSLYQVALHNLRDFRERVIPVRIPVPTLYRYLKRFVEPDIIYIDAKRNQRTMFWHMRLFRSRLCAATIGSGVTPKASFPCNLSYTSWPRLAIATSSPRGQHGF
jgi:hypothetical protein